MAPGSGTFEILLRFTTPTRSEINTMITLKKSALSIPKKPLRSLRKAARSCSPPAPAPKARAVVLRSFLGTMPTFPGGSEIFRACEEGSASDTNVAPIRMPGQPREGVWARAVSVFDQPGDHLWSQLDNEHIVNILDLLLQCGLANNSGNSGNSGKLAKVAGVI